MIGYVTLGTNDLDKARAYYDALLGSIGASRLMEFGERFHPLRHRLGPARRSRSPSPMTAIRRRAGNGNMVAIVDGEPRQGRRLPRQGARARRQRRGRARPARRRKARRPFTAPISAIPKATSSASSGLGPPEDQFHESQGDRQSQRRHPEGRPRTRRRGSPPRSSAAGVDADVRMTESGDIFEAFSEAAAAPGLDAVVAGGGDGTLSCAAGHLADSGRPLGILPLGTLNHLARDAGIPVEARGGGGGDRRRPCPRRSTSPRSTAGCSSTTARSASIRTWCGCARRSRSGSAAASGWRCCRPASPRCAPSAGTGCGSARRGWRRRSGRLCCSSATTATR